SGVTIQPGGPGVNYEKSEIPGGWIFTYSFQGSIPTGNWTVQLQSTGSAPIDYSLNGWLENAAVTLGADTVPTMGPVNSNFTIHATLNNGSLPIAGATVRALVAIVNGTSNQIVSLADDGVSPDAVANDGVYSGNFSSTSQAGTYNIAITATGSYLPNQPF